jgi:hypothetical protein
LLVAGSLLVLGLLGVWLASTGSDGESVDPLGLETARPKTQGSDAHAPLLTDGVREDGNNRATSTPENGEPESQGVELLVRLVDSRGELVPEAQVGITGPDGVSRFSMRRADRQHAFPGLVPGTWVLRTYAQGFLDLEQTLELAEEPASTEVELQLAAAPLFPVRFLTPAGENAIEVLDALESSPLRGSDLFVIATRSRPEATIPRLAPGARPQYGIGLYHNIASLVPGQSAIPRPGDGYAGVLELKQAPPAFVSCVLRETVLETVQVSGSTSSDLVFTVVPEQLQSGLASASVTVLDARTHAPIEGVRVTCDDTGIAGSGEDGSSIDDEGGILFEQRYPGWATLRAWAPGYEVVQHAVLLEAGQRKDLGTILLEPELTVRGSVKNSAGKGVRSVLYARDESWGETEGPPEIGHTLGSSGNDGALVLNRLGQREYRVHVKAREHAPKFFDLDLRDGAPESLDLILEPGTRITLSSAYDAGLTHLVTIHDTRGNLCFSERIPGRRTRETWLAPGEYRVTLQHGPRELSSETLVVTESSAIHVLQ